MPSTAALRPPSSPARIASPAAAPCGHAPAAGNTSESNIRYSRVAIDQHRQEHAGKQRGHEIGPAEHEGNADRQHQCIAGTERCSRDSALRQVLNVDRAVAQERHQRDSGKRHTRERTDQRRVGRDPQSDDQLHADDGAHHAERRNQQQRAKFDEAGMNTRSTGLSNGVQIAHPLPPNLIPRPCRSLPAVRSHVPLPPGIRYLRPSPAPRGRPDVRADRRSRRPRQAAPRRCGRFRSG